MKVALYLRRSTNERLQADSLKVQEQILRQYATEHDMEVVALYRDSASGTSTKQRAQFLAMVEAITHGAGFEAVLVRDVSRFGRFFDIDEGAFFEVLFLGHGVRTVYCEEAFATDTSPMASLVKSVRRVMASEYARDRSRLVRYAQSRATKLGFHAGGPPAFGMRRVMVTAEGRHVQELGAGEWKALANHRTRLVPGNPEAVAVVRRIFDLFDQEDYGIAAIARLLNAKSVPSPRGSKWYEGTVASVLTNSVYAGFGHYRPRRRGSTDPLQEAQVEGLTVLSAPGHHGIIEPSQFRRVQERLAQRTRQRSNAALAADARRAFEIHGCVQALMLKHLSTPATAATYFSRFRYGLAEALERAYAEEIATTAAPIVNALRAAFDVREEDNEYVVDGALRLRVQPSFPHRRRSGTFWRFDTREPTDVVVGFAMWPDGSGAGTFWVLRGEQLALRTRGLFLRCEDTRRSPALRSVDQVVGVVAQLRYTCGRAAEERFMAAAMAQPVIVFARLARELEWPPHAVARLYWKLVGQGEWLPPMKYKAGRLLEIVCGRCGRRRWARPNRALALRSNECATCTTQRPSHRVLIRCPLCGREAERWPSAVKKLSNGPQTVCRSCRARTEPTSILLPK
jgi:DNA invertase Pin-like site-specific DNA recombinase